MILILYFIIDTFLTLLITFLSFFFTLYFSVTFWECDILTNLQGFKSQVSLHWRDRCVKLEIVYLFLGQPLTLVLGSNKLLVWLTCDQISLLPCSWQVYSLLEKHSISTLNHILMLPVLLN